MNSDPDLPEPRPRSYKNAEDRQRHQWKLVSALLVAAVLYSTLHKLVLPLFLSRLRVFEVQYGQVDYWFIPAWALLFWLGIRKSLGVVGSLLAGLLVAYGAWDLILVLSKFYVGWLSMSHLLSSLPVALSCLIMLSFPNSNRSLKSAWAGAFAGVIIFVSIGGYKVTQDTTTLLPAQSQNIAVPALQANTCGQESFQFKASELTAFASSTVIHLRDCGLSPQALWSDGNSLLIQSQLKRTVNIHIVFVSSDFRPLRHVNKILKPLGRTDLNFGGLRKGESAGLLFSDASFAKGAVVLVSTTQRKREGRFVVRARRELSFEAGAGP